MKFYLIIGVDQDGDAIWDIKTTYNDAVVSAKESNTVTHTPVELHLIMFSNEVVTAKLEYPR